MAQAGVPCMTFCIGFVHHVQTQLVTQIEKTRIVRIMGTTHCIHIVLLHQHKICAHVFHADGLAFIGMMVVAIDSANHHALPIHQQRVAIYAHRTKARLYSHNFAHFVKWAHKFADHAIPVWILGAPQINIVYVPVSKSCDMAIKHVRKVEPCNFAGPWLAHLFPRHCFQTRTHHPATFKLCSHGNRHLHIYV